MLTIKQNAAHEKKDLLLAFYDFAACPTTFDFINFLCLANVARAEKKCSSFIVVFVPGHHQGFRSQTHLSLFEKEHRVNNIIFPSTHLSASCSGYINCKNRSEAARLLKSATSNVFPEAYSVLLPVGFYSWKATWSEINKGNEIQSIRAPRPALNEARKWLHCNTGSKKPVVITIRNSRYQKERNSDNSEWKKFAEYLISQDCCPVFIPDHEALFIEQNEFPKDSIICRPAALDICFRTALYELSYLSMFVNNGPWLLAILNPNVRFIALKIITEKYGVTSNSWMVENGFTPNINPSFLKPHQKFVWEEDTAENLIQTFIDATNANSGLNEQYLNSLN